MVYYTDSCNRIIELNKEDNMKITTFNPMILTKKPEEAIALFEALGIVVL